jgi:hypothetical protein
MVRAFFSPQRSQRDTEKKQKTFTAKTATARGGRAKEYMKFFPFSFIELRNSYIITTSRRLRGLRVFRDEGFCFFSVSLCDLCGEKKGSPYGEPFLSSSEA